MISQSDYIQLKAFARVDGLILGCIWTIAFACFIGSMSDASLQLGFMVGVLCTPFVLYYMLRNFRDKVLDGSISFRRGFAFTAFTGFYASIIIGAATFVYFQFMDNGKFFGRLLENIKVPEIAQAFRDAGMNPDEIASQMTLLAQMRPVDVAFSVFFDGTLTAVVLGLLIGLLGRRKRNDLQSVQKT